MSVTIAPPCTGSGEAEEGGKEEDEPQPASLRFARGAGTGSCVLPGDTRPGSTPSSSTAAAGPAAPAQVPDPAQSCCKCIPESLSTSRAHPD